MNQLSSRPAVAKLILGTLIAIAASGCARPGGNADVSSAETMNQFMDLFSSRRFGKNLTVVDQNGKPIPNAQILIGSDLNQPFANNFIATDSVGGFQAPDGWSRPEAVTISAPGFVRATYLKQSPKGQSFALRPIEGGNLYQLNGHTTGHNVVDYDGQIDFGLVIPAISKAGFFNLDISDFISTDTDTITVAGKSMALPSNITLPKQQESYFITIELNKPDYRLNFKNNGMKPVFAAKGRFALDDMVNAYQSGKQIFELANNFSMLGGVIKEVTLNGSKTTENLDTTKMAFRSKVSVTGPQMRSDEMTMATPLSPYKEYYYPTDVKNLEQNRRQDLTVDTSNGSLLTILKKKSEAQPKNMVDRMSISLQTLKNGMTPTLLPLMSNPSVKSAFEVSIPTINNLGGLYNGASYAVLSHVKKVPMGKNTVDVLSNIWEVYSPEWESHVSIPQWPNEKAPAGSLRWQVTLTAVPSQMNNVDLGPKWLEAATHATRSSADF